uniref:MFS domain-containing protein n=1 Tax=Angiostrongylus cantonensis TaxID=6313 RepID=A0A0K0DEK9_ANGCA
MRGMTASSVVYLLSKTFLRKYVRKWIMVVGIAIWVFSVFASTFVQASMFWLFMFLRGMVGIGEASYAVVSPSIIADMFTGTNRSRMLMFFYFAIPCGSGFGFMVGSSVAAMTGVVCLFLIIVFVKEPARGGAERPVHGPKKIRTSYFEDLKSLAGNATYVFSTAGYTAMIFMVGTMSWWVPTAIEHNYAHERGLNSTDQLDPDTKAQLVNTLVFLVNLIFGAITCIGGLVGVTVGSILSQWLHEGVGPFRSVKTVRSDAIVCGLGALISIPSLYFALREIPYNMAATWVRKKGLVCLKKLMVLMFICITSTCFNWATNVNMLMEVVVPTRRNAAVSWQTLISHLFGDASGPYVLGMISDAIRGDDTSPYGNFTSLVASFYLPNFLLVISTASFFAAAYTFVRDQKIVEEEMSE